MYLRSAQIHENNKEFFSYFEPLLLNPTCPVRYNTSHGYRHKIAENKAAGFS